MIIQDIFLKEAGISEKDITLSILVRTCQRLPKAIEERAGKPKSALEQSTRFSKELIILEAKHRSAAKDSEESVKMLHDDISRLRGEIESVRIKAKWELCMIRKEAAKSLGRAKSLQGSLRTEREKPKCSIEATATGLEVSVNAGDEFNLDVFLKSLSTSNKSSQDTIEKRNFSVRKTSKGPSIFSEPNDIFSAMQKLITVSGEDVDKLEASWKPCLAIWSI